MNSQTGRSLDELEKRLSSFGPSSKFPHDKYILATLYEALAAAREGNFGVGAVLVNERGEVVERGHNRVFWPYFRSDLHAEMDVLTKFETDHRDTYTLRAFALFTSLEPCPMCLARLITSGINKVYYAVGDDEAGMVRRLRELPRVWVELAKRQEFGLATCAPELRDIAWEIFQSTAEENNRRLAARVVSAGKSSASS